MNRSIIRIDIPDHEYKRVDTKFQVRIFLNHQAVWIDVDMKELRGGDIIRCSHRDGHFKVFDGDVPGSICGNLYHDNGVNYVCCTPIDDLPDENK